MKDGMRPSTVMAPLRRADPAAKRHRQQHRRNLGHAADDQHADDEAGEAVDRPDREVDLGGDQHEGGADREDAEHRDLAQQLSRLTLWRKTGETMANTTQSASSAAKTPASRVSR